MTTKMNKTILIAIVAGVAFWLIDSYVDAILFKEGYFQQSAAGPNPAILFFRVMMVALFIAFGFFIRHLFIKDLRISQKLRESEQLFRKVFEDGALAMSMAGKDYRLFRVNPAMCRMFGYTEEEMFSLTFPEITHPDSLDSCLIMAEKVFKGEIPYISMEKQYIKKGGGIIWGHLTASVIRDDKGEFLYFLAMIKDITERKAIEEKLNLYADELEWKNLTLERARDEAEEATRLKGKFVSLVSHDLKSPLTSIIGFLGLLTQDTECSLGEEQKVMLKIIYNSSNSMLKMINNTLEVSRLQMGRITPNRTFIDGHNLTRDILLQLGQLASEKEIELVNELPQGTRLFADMELFSMVIKNLLSNAIKFCRKGDRVAILVPQGSKATIAVKDTGQGIKKNILPDLFKHDVKTSTEGTAGERGTGLGLPFSMEIMEAHGGTVTVESEEGVGSVFYVELPEVKPNILVVEDEADTRLLLSKTMEKIDVKIVEAETAEKGLEVLKAEDVHLIILDIKLPEMDGFQMLESIRKDQKTVSVPVILITGKVPEAREKAIRMGANDFVTKPFDREQFVQKVKNFAK